MNSFLSSDLLAWCMTALVLVAYLAMTAWFSVEESCE